MEGSQPSLKKEKKLKITNCKQFELLVQLMEKNIPVARGYMNFGSTKEEYTNIWNGVGDRLNSVGPPTRTTSEWQKVWNDYKGKVKAKLGHNKREIIATGGGCNNLYSFTAQEESVIDILTLREVSQPDRITFGLGPSSSNAVQVVCNTETPKNVDGWSNIDTSVVMDLEISCEDQTVENIQPERNNLKAKGSSGSKRGSDDRQERMQLLKEQTAIIKRTEQHNKDIARYQNQKN